MEILREFNLTDNEIKIYLELLKLGSALAGKLTNETGIHRRNVYDSLERLIKKGLVGYINKNNIKYFKATDPKHFYYLIEKEREVLEKREKSLKKFMPQLLLHQNLTTNTQRVTVFEGQKGLIGILEDVIKTGKQNLVFSTSDIHHINHYLKIFHKKRIKAKIKDKIILNKSKIQRAKKLSKLPYTEVRIMEREFDSPLAINVYANKVGMLLFTETPLAILIEDNEIANSFKKYFKLLWNGAQKV